jgi:gas vesicle protein
MVRKKWDIAPSRRFNFSSLEKRKEKINMPEHKNQRGHIFWGFLMGSFLGALAGIFFAPKSGKDLRSDIKDKGREALKDAKEIYTDASAKAKEIIEKAKHRAGELKKETDRYLSAARQEGKEILTRGEPKVEANR